MVTAKSRHSAPIFHRDGQEAVALKRVHLGDGGHEGEQREHFIQNLVYKNPEVIPTADIEPAFAPLVSVCTELPTEAGYLDNFWITPSGGIVLGECKLVKNPQARREVVVQALDYARAISSWRFEQLEGAVRKALKRSDAKLWDFVSSDVTEPEFVDAIERRLRLGQIMILIIGDGIQEGVETLTSHLQLHAGMHAGLALVELSIWQGAEGGLLIVPRIPLKTVIVERGVVRIDESNRVRVDRVSDSPVSSSGPRSQSISEADFYVQLEQKRAGLSVRLRRLIDDLAALNVTPEPGGKSLFLRWQSPESTPVTIACVEPTGKVWSARALSDTRKIGMASAAEQYLLDIANMIGGSVKVYDNGSREALTSDNKAVDLETLLDSSQWATAISTFVSKLAAAEHA